VEGVEGDVGLGEVAGSIMVYVLEGINGIQGKAKP